MSTNIRTLRPVLRIGQRTDPTREFTLAESDGKAKSIDLTNAQRVTLTMEHYTRAFTAVSDGECTIVNPKQGTVEYDFSMAETSVYGRYYVQFEVTWDDGSDDLIPPSGYEWVLDIGRRQPDNSPLEVPRVYADEGVFGDLEAEQAHIHALTGMETPAGEYVTDLYGQNLYYENGRLNAFDPTGTGEVFDHMHTGTAGDGGSIGAAASPAAPAHIQSVTLSNPVDSTSAPERSATKAYADTKADKDNGETTGLTNLGAFTTDGLDVTGWNWVDVTNHGVPTHDINTATLQNVTARTDYPDYASCVGPINNLFTQFGNGTVFIFPAGDYWVPWDEIISASAGGITEDLAIVCKEGARFVHEPFTEKTDAAGNTMDKWLRLYDTTVGNPIENLHLSGMTVNFEADECGRGIQTTTSGESTIEDLTIVGQHDALDSGERPLTPRVPDEQGVLTIDGYRATDGALWDNVNYDMGAPANDSLRHQAILVTGGAENRGTVIIRDCELARWTSHAIYASKTDGPVRVIRPRLYNNRGVGVRIGATGSTVDNPRIIIDNTTGQISDYDSIRPIRAEGTGQTGGGEDITIRNPEIILRSVPQSITRYAIEIDPTIRSATVEGGYVYANEPQQLTRFDAATVPNDGLVIEDLTFKRDAPPASDALSSVAAINLYREKVTLRDVTVRCQMNDGLSKSRGVLCRSNHCVIDGGTFYADQGGIMFGGSENVIRGNVHINTNGDGIEYISGSDNRMNGMSKSLIQEAGKSVQSGGRSRWNGIIGAGPLGGIDLSTTHGKEIGDLAISNGSAGDVGFPDGSMARWRGSSWVRVDGQASITPP